MVIILFIFNPNTSNHWNAYKIRLFVSSVDGGMNELSDNGTHTQRQANKNKHNLFIYRMQYFDPWSSLLVLYVQKRYTNSIYYDCGGAVSTQNHVNHVCIELCLISRTHYVLYRTVLYTQEPD